MDLNGNDKIIHRLKNKRNDTSEKKTSFDDHFKTIEQLNARRIDTNTNDNTFQNINRIA